MSLPAIPSSHSGGGAPIPPAAPASLNAHVNGPPPLQVAPLDLSLPRFGPQTGVRNGVPFAFNQGPQPLREIHVIVTVTVFPVTVTMVFNFFI